MKVRDEAWLSSGGSSSKSRRGGERPGSRVEMTVAGAGIELSCLSTISRSVSVMQRNKSAQPPVSVCGQELGKEGKKKKGKEEKKEKNCVTAAGSSDPASYTSVRLSLTNEELFLLLSGVRFTLLTSFPFGSAALIPY